MLVEQTSVNPITPRVTESLRLPEMQRISVSALFSIQMPDGSYLFKLNDNRLREGVFEVGPIGGAYKYNPSDPNWAAFGFEPEQGLDLRGQIPVSKTFSFFDYVRTGQGRETTGKRELTEELITFIQAYNPDISISDFVIRFDRSCKTALQTPRTEVKNQWTSYLFEIFHLTPNKKAVEAIYKAVEEEEGFVLLTEKQVREHLHPTKPILIRYQGKEVKAILSETCHYVLKPEAIPPQPPPESQAVLRQRAYQIAKKIAFGAEGKAFPEYRLTLKDIKMFRKLADKELVDKLERELVIHRLTNYLADKFLGGVSEGVLVYTTAAEMRGQEYRLLELLAILGFITSDTISKEIVSSAESQVAETLLEVFNDIADKFQADQRLLRLPDLHVLAEKWTRLLAAAEIHSPIVAENLPSAVAVNAGLISQNLALTAAVYSSLLTGVGFITQKALEGANQTGVRNFIIARAFHLVSSLSRYAPILAARLFPGGNALSLNVVVSSIGTKHVLNHLNAGREITDGSDVIQEMRSVLGQLGKLSLATPELRRKHAARMSQTVPPYETRKKDGAQRFALLDQLIEERFREEPRLLVLFHNFTFALEDKIYLDKASLALTDGITELVIPSGGGRTVILKALAGALAHSQGIPLLRRPDRDVNLYQELDEPGISYVDCGYLPYNVNPFEQYGKEKTAEIAKFLEWTGMFSEKEIEIFVTNHPNAVHGTGSLRSRLMIAAAFLRQAPVLLLDDPFNPRLTKEEREATACFLAKIASSKIIMISSDGSLTDHRDIFEKAGVYQGAITVKDRQFALYPDEI